MLGSYFPILAAPSLTIVTNCQVCQFVTDMVEFLPPQAIVYRHASGEKFNTSHLCTIVHYCWLDPTILPLQPKGNYPLISLGLLLCMQPFYKTLSSLLVELLSSYLLHCHWCEFSLFAAVYSPTHHVSNDTSHRWKHMF
jgi:hypothetical protein